MVDVAAVDVVSREQVPTYLALVVSSIRCRLQCALQSALIVSSSQQLPYLLRSVLDVGGRYGLNGRCEGGQVEIGGAVRVEGVDIDRPPVDVGHYEGSTGASIGVGEGSSVRRMAGEALTCAWELAVKSQFGRGVQRAPPSSLGGSRLPKAAGASFWRSRQLSHKQGSALITAKTTRYLYLNVLGTIDVAVATSNGVTGTTAISPMQRMRRSQQELGLSNMENVYNGNVVHWY